MHFEFLTQLTTYIIIKLHHVKEQDKLSLKD